MPKIQLIEPDKFNRFQSLEVQFTPGFKGCQIQVEDDGDEAWIDLGPTDMANLINLLTTILTEKEVPNV